MRPADTQTLLPRPRRRPRQDEEGVPSPHAHSPSTPHALASVLPAAASPVVIVLHRLDEAAPANAVARLRRQPRCGRRRRSPAIASALRDRLRLERQLGHDRHAPKLPRPRRAVGRRRRVLRPREGQREGAEEGSSHRGGELDDGDAIIRAVYLDARSDSSFPHPPIPTFLPSTRSPHLHLCIIAHDNIIAILHRPHPVLSPHLLTPLSIPLPPRSASPHRRNGPSASDGAPGSSSRKAVQRGRWVGGVLGAGPSSQSCWRRCRGGRREKCRRRGERRGQRANEAGEGLLGTDRRLTAEAIWVGSIKFLGSCGGVLLRACLFFLCIASGKRERERESEREGERRENHLRVEIQRSLKSSLPSNKDVTHPS